VLQSRDTGRPAHSHRGGANGPAGRGENSVDWVQLKALLKASVKLDLRTSRAGVGRGKLPPFAVALITYAVMGSLMAVGLRPHGDLFVYSLFTLSAAMFMTALAVIMEYVTIVAHPDDFQILAHRPVSSRTYFWAKLGNLFFYVTPIALALILPAAIVGSATLTEGVRFGVVHILTGIVACLATAAAVVLLYTATLRVVSYERFTQIMTYVHSGATLVLVLAYFLLPRMIEDDPMLLSLSRGAWVYAAPPAWFAGAVELLSGAGSRQDIHLVLLAVGSAAVVIGAAMNTISLEYSRKISELTTSSVDTEERAGRTRRRRPFFRLGLASLSSGTERAGYLLMDSYMRRDRKLRARVYPAFGLPLAVYLTALIRNDLHSPFVPAADGGPVALQEIMGLYCIFVSLFFATAMSQSEQWKASWIFHAAPISDRARVLQGARRLVIWRYLIPFFGLLFILLSVRIPVLGAAVFVLMVFPMCLTAFSILSLASPHMPLSQEVERGRQGRQIAFFMLLGMTMVPLLIVLQLLMQERSALTGPMLVGLWLLAWASDRLVAARLRRKLAALDFIG
jgi:ABC-2 type transport system permease protein